jgi:hypothetical protein
MVKSFWIDRIILTFSQQVEIIFIFSQQVETFDLEDTRLHAAGCILQVSLFVKSICT